jgi:hypothetical protein
MLGRLKRKLLVLGITPMCLFLGSDFQIARTNNPTSLAADHNHKSARRSDLDAYANNISLKFSNP